MSEALDVLLLLHVLDLFIEPHVVAAARCRRRERDLMHGASRSGLHVPWRRHGVCRPRCEGKEGKRSSGCSTESNPQPTLTKETVAQ